jgi:hypothetical protein
VRIRPTPALSAFQFETRPCARRVSREEQRESVHSSRALPDTTPVSHVYRVPKHKLPVELVSAGGLEERGFLFRSEHAEVHSGPERAIDLLNGESEFIVFEDERSQVNFLSRNSVALVTLVSDASGSDPITELEPLEADLDIQATVRILLEDGISLEGVTRYQLPAEHSRVLDFLNTDSRFLPLVHDGRVSFVNKTRIVRVMPSLED